MSTDPSRAKELVDSLVSQLEETERRLKAEDADVTSDDDHENDDERPNIYVHSAVKTLSPDEADLASGLESILPHHPLSSRVGKKTTSAAAAGTETQLSEMEMRDLGMTNEEIAAELRSRCRLSADMIIQRIIERRTIQKGASASTSTSTSTTAVTDLPLEIAIKETMLYLDGMGITAIDALDPFIEVTHLYLQRNQITVRHSSSWCQECCILWNLFMLLIYSPSCFLLTTPLSSLPSSPPSPCS